jgi:hypothetical protein
MVAPGEGRLVDNARLRPVKEVQSFFRRTALANSHQLGIKMQLLKSIPVTILYCVAVIAAPVTPRLRLSEVQKIEPSSYKVDLTVDPEKVQFSGTIQIKFRVLRPAE